MGWQGRTTAYLRIPALKPLEFHLGSHKSRQVSFWLVVRINLSDLTRRSAC
jgi:hypothetical protein